ncbi:KdsC family phosphatase [Arachidicoccus sp.]|jgi:3-deoxy-D-manno-octulosonate 8-phosphate phosphatase (KDO 8-P phosphatase)|uniref:KdsC family phosphatase n=1 Tax=Arachidicoccus sp. TaxID=1872624 RepID=UPI003D20D6C4
MNALELFKKVKAFVFDIDGVLTNGDVLILPDEHLIMARSMNTKDGYAIQMAIKQGFSVAIISGGKESGAEKRLEYLGIQHIFMGISDKKKCFDDYLQKSGLQQDSVLYMGDDIPDFEVMQTAGIRTCPADAVTEIKNLAQYISSFKGGSGCVRDVIEKTLKLQGHWPLHTTVKTI